MRNYDPTDLDSQQRDARDARMRKTAELEVAAQDIRWLMESKRGRRILWRILETAGPFRSSFDANALRMAFNEGLRYAGNKLLTEVMTLCPEQYTVMVKENTDGNDGNGKPTN